MISTSESIFKELKKFISLPDGVTKLTITLSTGEMARISIDGFVIDLNGHQFQDGDLLRYKDRKYVLVPDRGQCGNVQFLGKNRVRFNAPDISKRR